jgi:hypothetical protein
VCNICSVVSAQFDARRALLISVMPMLRGALLLLGAGEHTNQTHSVYTYHCVKHCRNMMTALMSKGEVVLTERPSSLAQLTQTEAQTLANNGLLVSVRSTALLNRLSTSVHCIAWLREVCAASDGCCSLVGDAFTDSKLYDLMAADMHLPRRLVFLAL